MLLCDRFTLPAFACENNPHLQDANNDYTEDDAPPQEEQPSQSPFDYTEDDAPPQEEQPSASQFDYDDDDNALQNSSTSSPSTAAQRRRSTRTRLAPSRFSSATAQPSRHKKAAKKRPRTKKANYSDSQRQMLLDGFQDFCSNPGMWRSNKGYQSIRMINLCSATGLNLQQVGKWFYARSRLLARLQDED